MKSALFLTISTQHVFNFNYMNPRDKRRIIFRCSQCTVFHHVESESVLDVRGGGREGLRAAVSLHLQWASCLLSLCALLLGHVQLCSSMDCRPPGASVHGTLQAKVPECSAMPSSRGSSQPRPPVLQEAIWATIEAQEYLSEQPIPSPGDFPDPRIKPGSSALQADPLPAELPEKPTLSSSLNSWRINLSPWGDTFWMHSRHLRCRILEEAVVRVEHLLGE